MSVADFRAALDEMAAAYTVSVGREETGVTLDVPAEDAWRALDLFAAVLQAPAFGVASAAAMGRRSQTEGIDWGELDRRGDRLVRQPLVPRPSVRP